MNPLLTFDNVTKCFGTGDATTWALQGISLQVTAGEFVAIMGPSGCGKSTLLHLAGGLDDPTTGHVVVNGRTVAECNAAARSELRRREVTYVFQRLNLVASLTAVENVMMPLELDGITERNARPRALEALERVGLTGHLDRFPSEFSGGQQQRIAIARAIVGGQSLVLADEPTGALDTAGSDEIVELLRQLATSAGTAVVLVTHEPRLASWADRVVFLRDGLVVSESKHSTSEGGM